MKTLYNTCISFKNISNVLGGFSLFCKLVFVFLYWKLVSHKMFKLTCAYKGKKFYFYVDTRADLAALDEIFVKKEYEYEYRKAGIEKPQVIVDLGANIGDTSVFYALLYPDATIYAVEPNPSVHKKLIQNTQQFSNVQVRMCAISNSTGKIILHVGDSHLGSSLVEREQNTSSVEVDTYTMKDFCEKEHIDMVDILKFDIEGAEEYVLADSTVSTKVRCFVGEMHDDLVTTPIDSLLKKSNARVLEKMILSNPARYIIFATYEGTRQ